MNILRDRFGNVATGYTGTIRFASSDGQATLAPDSTLVNGFGTFSFTLKTAGQQTVTATDTAAPSITAEGGVSVSPWAATHLTVEVPSTAAAGVAFTVTVRAATPSEMWPRLTASRHASCGPACLPAHMGLLDDGVGTLQF